ncbi:MAG: 16S rRNA (adenine(1518)-N(6)/adenine(1519)-N(6))-dimethyltransferase RsmA [Candidatus Dormibacteraceae bacterium]
MRGRPSPRRRLGQNFLTDPGLLGQVVEAAGITPEDQVLEVGAGTGTLTRRLVPLARRVVAVELDERLLPALRHAAPAAEVLAQDVLTIDLATLFPDGGEVLVGNIPYYLTGALLRRVLDARPLPKRLSFVVQREVAERWCGIGGWSLATVVAQTLTRPELRFLLPPEAFDPPPRVWSALARLDVRRRPAISVPDLRAFFRFAEALFQFRRKQLGGSLTRVTGLPRGTVVERLGARGIDPARRPETLRLDEWEHCYLAFGQGTTEYPIA